MGSQATSDTLINTAGQDTGADGLFNVLVADYAGDFNFAGSGDSTALTFNAIENLTGDDIGNDVFNVSKAIDTLTGLGGNDVFNIQATSRVTTIYAGAGTDTINVGSLAPATPGTLDGMVGQLVVHGEDDGDTLNADAGEDVLTLRASGDSSGVNFNGGLDDDTFNVQGTGSGSATLIKGDAGVNTINIGSLAPATGGIVDNIHGALEIQSAGDDIAKVDDTGSAGWKVGTLTPTTLTGLGMGPDRSGLPGITYTGLATLNIYLGAGGAVPPDDTIGNVFYINDIEPLTHTTVDGGISDNDTVLATFAQDFDGRLDLTAFEHGTVTVARDFNGTLTDTLPGHLETITIGHAFNVTGALLARSIDEMTIGPDQLQVGSNMAGQITVQGLLGSLRVAGGTPGTIVAGHVGMSRCMAGLVRSSSRSMRIASNGSSRKLPNRSLPAAQPSGDRLGGDTVH